MYTIDILYMFKMTPVDRDTGAYISMLYSVATTNDLPYAYGNSIGQVHSTHRGAGTP
jgi:hypothetical protein